MSNMPDYSDSLKREILEARGFQVGNQNIRQYFSQYKKGCAGSWRIKGITADDIVSCDNVFLINTLFCKDSIENGFSRAGGNYITWNTFASLPSNGRSPRPDQLEPFIARFVLAANTIGAFTTMSCDGWHKDIPVYWNPYFRSKYPGDRFLTLWMQDRYSVIWLWLVMQYVFHEDWDGRNSADYSTKWINKWEPDDAGPACYDGRHYMDHCMMLLHIVYRDPLVIYRKILFEAGYIIQHAEELRTIRKQWISAFHAEVGIDQRGFISLTKSAAQSVGRDLSRLAVDRNCLLPENLPYRFFRMEGVSI